MGNINKDLIYNLLKHSELLLEKTILLSEDIKTVNGEDTRLRLGLCNEDERNEIMDKIIKEWEQIRLNSATVLTNIIQIQDLNK